MTKHYSREIDKKILASECHTDGTGDDDPNNDFDGDGPFE